MRFLEGRAKNCREYGTKGVLPGSDSGTLHPEGGVPKMATHHPIKIATATACGMYPFLPLFEWGCLHW